MVTFRLIEETERFIIIYWYFPNGNEDSHGIIVIDKENDTIDITELAPDDFLREVSVQEQNSLRDSVNEMRKKDGEPELTEEEWPSTEESIIHAFFGDHAVSKICEAYNKGEIPAEGMSAWY